MTDVHKILSTTAVESRANASDASLPAGGDVRCERSETRRRLLERLSTVSRAVRRLTEGDGLSVDLGERSLSAPLSCAVGLAQDLGGARECEGGNSDRGWRAEGSGGCDAEEGKEDTLNGRRGSSRSGIIERKKWVSEGDEEADTISIPSHSNDGEENYGGRRWNEKLKEKNEELAQTLEDARNSQQQAKIDLVSRVERLNGKYARIVNGAYDAEQLTSRLCEIELQSPLSLLALLHLSYDELSSVVGASSSPRTRTSDDTPSLVLKDLQQLLVHVCKLYLQSLTATDRKVFAAEQALRRVLASKEIRMRRLEQELAFAHTETAALVERLEAETERRKREVAELETQLSHLTELVNSAREHLELVSDDDDQIQPTADASDTEGSGREG